MDRPDAAVKEQEMGKRGSRETPVSYSRASLSALPNREIFGFVPPAVFLFLLKIKDLLALFAKMLDIGCGLSLPARLQPLKLGDRMVELPIDHSFIPQQSVELFLLRQEEMIRHGIHFRVAQGYRVRFSWIVCS